MWTMNDAESDWMGHRCCYNDCESHNSDLKQNKSDNQSANWLNGKSKRQRNGSGCQTHFVGTSIFHNFNLPIMNETFSFIFQNCRPLGKWVPIKIRRRPRMERERRIPESLWGDHRPPPVVAIPLDNQHFLWGHSRWGCWPHGSEGGNEANRRPRETVHGAEVPDGEEGEDGAQDVRHVHVGERGGSLGTKEEGALFANRGGEGVAGRSVWIGGRIIATTIKSRQGIALRSTKWQEPGGG